MTKEENAKNSILYHAKCIEKLLNEECGSSFRIDLQLRARDTDNNLVGIISMGAKEGIADYLGYCCTKLFEDIHSRRKAKAIK